MKLSYFENEFAEYWIEEGILFFIYKPGISMTLEAAKRVVKDRLEVQKGESYPVFCDMRGIKDSDKPARDYLAKEGTDGFSGYQDHAQFLPDHQQTLNTD
jgi:hypothetical protein